MGTMEMMEMTVSLKELAFILIVIALLVLLGYCIALIKNLIVTIKHTNKILEDTEVITAITASKAQAIDGIINDVSETVGNVSDFINGTASPIKAISVIINAAAAVKSIITGEKTPEAATAAAKAAMEKAAREEAVKNTVEETAPEAM